MNGQTKNYTPHLALFIFNLFRNMGNFHLFYKWLIQIKWLIKLPDRPLIVLASDRVDRQPGQLIAQLAEAQQVLFNIQAQRFHPTLLQSDYLSYLEHKKSIRS